MPNPLCHFELMTADPKRCRAFYERVMDWQFDEQSMPGYTLINAGTEPTGAIFKKPENAPHACVNVYFHVEDIEATLAQVTQNGGKVLLPRTEVPNTGYFAMFSDPEGLVIGLMQPAGA